MFGRTSALGAASALLLASAGAAAEEPRWLASGGLWTASPLALESGLVVGASLRGQRRLLDGPLFAGVRASVGLTSEGNKAWVLEHRHGLLAAGVGAERTLGAGRVWAELGGGGLVVYELARRHQSERLVDLGLPGVVRESWSLGPSAFLELGVAVRFAGNWSATVAGGPTFTRQLVSGVARGVWGTQAAMGVEYAF